MKPDYSRSPSCGSTAASRRRMWAKISTCRCCPCRLSGIYRYAPYRPCCWVCFDQFYVLFTVTCIQFENCANLSWVLNVVGQSSRHCLQQGEHLQFLIVGRVARARSLAGRQTFAQSTSGKKSSS